MLESPASSQHTRRAKRQAERLSYEGRQDEPRHQDYGASACCAAGQSVGSAPTLGKLARCTHPHLPDKNHQVIAQFVAHGFAGAIKVWLGDDTLTTAEFVDAAVAAAPVWWS